MKRRYSFPNTTVLIRLLQHQRRNLVIDRSFVDSKGMRWIADCKTSGYEGVGFDAFLDRERVRHAARLERHARVLARETPANPGLHFPLMAGWRDWQIGIDEPCIPAWSR